VLRPQDVCGSDETGPAWTEEQLRALWPQARRELLGFAVVLERRRAPITAQQIRMAVQLAQRRFAELSPG